MLFFKNKIKAVLFDYGNTLIEFGPDQIKSQYKSLENELIGIFGHCDCDKLKEVRDRQAVAPFSNGFIENNLMDLSKELIHELYNIIPEKHHIDALIISRYQSFINDVLLPENVLPLLVKLKQKYRIGIVSNYPCGRSIRDSLIDNGLFDILETVVVSGDVGYIKPHPKPFETALDLLDLRPDQCVYIGDNLLADVQGSKRMGMYSILTEQYKPYVPFDISGGDLMPDLKIKKIEELEELLLS